MALPYTAPYVRASDVVLGIEGDVGPDGNSRIIEIGLWDTVAERLLTFAWTPTGWAGEDFRVEPGSALCLRIVSDFTWTPALISPEEP